MKYLVVIGDGMADNPVEALGGKTPLEYADIPTIDSLAARGTVGSVVNCPKPLPAGSETAILSIFGCDPLKHFSGRSPMEAAAIGLRLVPGDAAFRCNLVALEPGDQPYEEKRILSHSAGSITGQDALDVVAALNSDPEFSAALRAADMYIDPSPSFRPLAVKHHCDPSGVCFIPPHDHLGEVIGPLLPSGKDAALAKVFADLMRLANRVLEHHPVTEKRRAEGKLGANGIWFWAAGTAMQLPDFREEYGCGGAVISAVPLCHGIGVLRGLEMVEVEGATGEIDTNFEGKLEATWASLQKYDFVCLHLEAPDECTHNGDLKGKVQAIEWLDSRLVKPLTERLEAAHMDYRLLLLSDHKTLTATRGHTVIPCRICSTTAASTAGAAACTPKRPARTVPSSRTAASCCIFSLSAEKGTSKRVSRRLTLFLCLRRGGDRRLLPPNAERSVLRRDAGGAARVERSAEQQLGHGVLHLGADHAAQGPRAVERVEALVRDALDRRVLDRQRDAERRGALHGGLEHPPRNGRNVRAAQTAEHHGRVDAG